MKRVLSPAICLVCLLFLASSLIAADPAPTPPKGPGRLPTTPGIIRPVAATNLARTAPHSSLTNMMRAVRSPLAATNAVAAKPGWTAQFKQRYDKLKTNRAFYPAVIAGGLGVLAAIWFLVSALKEKKKTQPAEAALAVARPAMKPAKGARRGAVNVCNVLSIEPDARRLWVFDAGGGRFTMNRQQTSTGGEALPANLITKSWANLFRTKLNIACLPADQVFLRVAQFPLSDFNETLSMVELQLEKLSPIPVTQIVWTIQVLPHAKGNQQTVIVLIASSNAVEEFLGKLEGQGYLADSLELPLLDQLQATSIKEDGAWIYPEATGGTHSALVAWWYGGVLQSLGLLTLPPADRPKNLKEQLMQMAWAGEMEGWLNAPPTWHMVAPPAAAAEWEPALREGLEQPIEVLAPLSPAELAALTARRAARADARANLLPLDFSTRYQQQFVDRLWMRGLVAIGGIYMIGVAVYLVALGFLTYKTNGVELTLANTSLQYSNAVQTKARYQILKDRQELKFAALDCWKLVCQNMPTDLTLDSLNFADGKKLGLNGTAPGDQVALINEFEKAMRKSPDPQNPGQTFFDPLAGDHYTYHNIPGGLANWTFSLELKRAASSE